MPTIQLDPTLTMYYEDHCFADPWRQPEAVLLIHGIAESSRSWYGWVPHLARELRVLRVDQRGFGRSTAPPQGYPWSTESFAADLARFLDAMQVDSVHVVGAKFGGSIALQFAADYPERTRTLSVIGSPVQPRHSGAGLPRVPARIREVGVAGWAGETQRFRLGSEVPEEQIAWWTEFMGAASFQVCFEVTIVSAQIDLTGALPRLQAPTLMVTTQRSSLVELETVRDWQRRIPDSELLVMPGDSYHISAAKPDDCAQHVLEFIGRRG